MHFRHSSGESSKCQMFIGQASCSVHVLGSWGLIGTRGTPSSEPRKFRSAFRLRLQFRASPQPDDIANDCCKLLSEQMWMRHWHLHSQGETRVLTNGCKVTYKVPNAVQSLDVLWALRYLRDLVSSVSISVACKHADDHGASLRNTNITLLSFPSMK